jgi:uncharacterized protein YbbK (DUF523 family)
MKIVSACLAGINCRWNGKNRLNKKIKQMIDRGEVIAACPEVLGGLMTPRKPAGIYGGLGEDVLSGKATVRTSKNGEDVTYNFVRGAQKFLKMAKLKGVKIAILKDKSPSCGSRKTWQLDDRFKNHMVAGNGVLAALLKKNKIKVFTEKNFE